MATVNRNRRPETSKDIPQAFRIDNPMTLEPQARRLRLVARARAPRTVCGMIDVPADTVLRRQQGPPRPASGTKGGRTGLDVVLPPNETTDGHGPPPHPLR